jgi:hypothetical protein
MMMRELALARVYQLIEPGSVVLLTTARNGRANVTTMRHSAESHCFQGIRIWPIWRLEAACPRRS